MSEKSAVSEQSNSTGTPHWRDYLALTKPGVVMLLMVTAVAGMFLATDPPGMVPLSTFIPAFAGLYLAMMADDATVICAHLVAAAYGVRTADAGARSPARG